MALQEVVVEAMWEDRIEDEDEAPDENVTSSWDNSREEAEDSEALLEVRTHAVRPCAIACPAEPYPPDSPERALFGRPAT